MTYDTRCFQKKCDYRNLNFVQTYEEVNKAWCVSKASEMNLESALFVEDLMDDEKYLDEFQNSAWYAQPSGWTTSFPEEIWYGSVAQIKLKKSKWFEVVNFVKEIITIEWILSRVE